MPVPTSVYRYLDADGVLIYVGVTARGILRQGEHNAHASWWRFVCSQDVEHYDDRETALRRERYLIEKHEPPFNVTHNTDHARRLAAYLRLADPVETDPVWKEDDDYGLDCFRRGLLVGEEDEFRRQDKEFGKYLAFFGEPWAGWLIQFVTDLPGRRDRFTSWAMIPVAEDAIRALDAEIAEHGLTAALERATSAALAAVPA